MSEIPGPIRRADSSARQWLLALAGMATFLITLSTSAASAQTSVADLLGRPPAAEGQPRSYLEELLLYGFAENSYVWNLRHAGRGDVNNLRFYDHDEGYTFNAAELSVKKDPSEQRRLGFGAVLTAGEDSQKNHSLGIFRDIDDDGPFYRNTPKVDLPEASASYLFPIGSGLTLKAGKWATLIGYEVYETPKNLNFSRSVLYTLATPYTNTGLLATYQFTRWFGATAGFTNGWDNADNNNGYLRPTGSFAFTPTNKLSATVNYLFGPEQNRNQIHGDPGDHQRWIVDTVIIYTGIPQLTLATNFDFSGEGHDPALVALGTRKDTDSSWSGIAGYAAYDWTGALRTALRLEYFADPQGVRSSETIVPGHAVDLWEVTATLQYRLWRGLVGQLEYRHDQASVKAFSVQRSGPRAREQDTFTLALYYLFF